MRDGEVRRVTPTSTSNRENQQEFQQLSEALTVGTAGGRFVEFGGSRHCFYRTWLVVDEFFRRRPDIVGQILKW